MLNCNVSNGIIMRTSNIFALLHYPPNSIFSIYNLLGYEFIKQTIYLSYYMCFICSEIMYIFSRFCVL